jgi:pyridoxal phosphate enzyme (YggS family)
VREPRQRRVVVLWPAQGVDHDGCLARVVFINQLFESLLRLRPRRRKRRNIKSRRARFYDAASIRHDAALPVHTKTTYSKIAQRDERQEEYQKVASFHAGGSFFHTLAFPVEQNLKQNVQNFRLRIEKAASRAGRRPDEVTLIAACKSQPITKIESAVSSGITDFGENYAQELLDHATQVSASLRWHFIGHLQRNKVKAILSHVSMIHSLDSLELAAEIEKRAAALGKIQSVLIEINLAGEASKTGVSPEMAEALARRLKDFSHVNLQGLMTLPPVGETPEQSRPYFRNLREIRDAWNAKNVYRTPLADLSMGMTQDFETAIEEGATLVRIGTGLFGERVSK